MKFKNCEKYLLTVSLLLLLTIFLGFHSLNRLKVNNVGKLPFDYPLRNLLEHLLTGFYFPLIILFFVYIGWFLCLKLLYKKLIQIPKKGEIDTILTGSLIYILLEFYFQFILSYNSSSIPQIFISIIGVSLSWIYLYKIKFFD